MSIPYLIVALVFALGLMTKPMLVALPLVLLLLDYWPLGRFTPISLTQWKLKTGTNRWRSQSSIATRLILEKVPLLALSAASSVITLFAQGRAVVSAESLPLVWRINNAFVSYVAYIWQMICPIRLALIYPHPEDRLSFWEVAAAIVLLASVTVVVLIFGKTHRYLITGWFWYLGMLVPVIGIMQVGPQAHADRYTYLPQIGLYLMATWAVADLAMAWRYSLQILFVAAAVVIVVFMWLSWIQNTYWRDSETLWTHTLAVTSHNDIAHANLADVLLRRDRIDEAISHSEEALKIHPRLWNAHDTLALALFKTGRLDEAVAHWNESLKISPDSMNAQANLAWVFATSPDASMRNGVKAVELAKQVIERLGHTNDANAIIILRTLAAGYAESGRFPEAIDTARQALQLALGQNNSALTNSLQSNIANYRKNLPWRDPEAVNKAR